jgi:uncharacterized protein YegL
MERWYWLIAFCLMSLGIHVAVILHSPRLQAAPVVEPVKEVEVTLVAPPEPEKKPEAIKKPPEQPRPKVSQPPARSKTEVAQDKKLMNSLLKTAKRDLQPAVPIPVKPIDTPEKRPVAANAAPGGVDPLKEEKPLPAGLPVGVRNAGVPKLDRMARIDPNPGGGGSPAPGPVLGGKGGARGPEAPPEDILYNGGGAGGKDLPKIAPRIGGGGGRSILSVENPLAKDSIPEEKPGLGPGLAGGQGAGAGGGVGYSRDRGIGTRLDGMVALGTLKSKPGDGIGAGVGHNIGTRPPGGGKGTGSELPGTGGSGIGYGRGSGIGIGEGSGLGVGNGAGNRVGLNRGIPFGDVSGLLTGGSPNGGGGIGGGPGGPGRGAVFGAKPIGGGESVSIVYLLDVSGSMMQGDKIGKAKDALKKAISELKPRDKFNIVTFFGGARAFADEMVNATRGNVDSANLFIDFVQLKAGTNLSGALDIALQLEGLTHIFVMSDGEPTMGIRNPERLREAVKQWNEKHVRIVTLALGLGEDSPGFALLKAIAEDNNGQYSYINLARRR